jgi:hypothetical protein
MMTFEKAWEKIMRGDVLPMSEANMRKIAEAFFTAGKLAQTDENLARLGAVTDDASGERIP